MKEAVFSVYRSSAGSGKTRTLAKEYLLLALQNQGDYYKHILAVTFTNKATQEMKGRIVAYLVQYANGKFDDLANELMQELQINEHELRKRCQALQVHILHHYGNFGISTIDTFFQKIIRSFTRESGLAGDFTLELDTPRVIEDVVARMIANIGQEETLTKNIIAFAKSKLEEGKPWNIQQELANFAAEVFKEEFRLIEDEVFAAANQPDFFTKLSEKVFRTTQLFFSNIRKQAKEIEKKIAQQHLQQHTFKYGKSSAYQFIRKISRIKNDANLTQTFGARSQKEFLLSKGWTADESRQHWLDDNVMPAYEEIIRYFQLEGPKVAACQILLKQYHTFSLLLYFIQELKAYKEEQNILLLSDSPKLLNGIIAGSDTPFIYEKAGSFYKNFLIDEFQDTSLLQWNNFKPLVLNSIDQGYPCAVVGDVKQSIYRWRGGDLALLQKKVIHDAGSYRTAIKQLNTNYRSAETLVQFNNTFFDFITHQFFSGTEVSDIYADVKQHVFHHTKGEVQVQFFAKDGNKSDWKEDALESMAKYIEQLQEKKIPLSEIAILVRNKKDGQLIANFLLAKAKESPAYRYDVISNESLLVAQALSVQVIAACLAYLQRPDHLLARTNLLLAWQQINKKEIDHDAFSVSNLEVFESFLPTAFTKSKSIWRRLPLYELTEKIIGAFQLYHVAGEQLHLQTFLNHVLDFTGKERNSLQAFLQSWEWQSTQLSIQVSDQVNAVRIVTIHKSKGLQYPIVLIPFCDWSLDHEKSPLLWVKAKMEDFGVDGYLPIRYGKDLEQTIFEQDYVIEKRKALLDNLNILYVALTRAEKGLWLGAPGKKVTKDCKDVADLLFLSISHQEELQNNWKTNGIHWQMGEIDVHPNEQVEATSKTHFVYPVYDWRKRLVLRTSIDNPFLVQSKVKDLRLQGVRLHKVLQYIYDKTDVALAVEKAINDGLYGLPEKENLTKSIQQIVYHPQLENWFSSSWQIKTEASILLPDAGEKRLDRLMLNDKEIFILDYKSGEERKEDQLQMKEYMTIVRTMYQLPVKGFLYYLGLDKLVEVKNTGGKHQAQLQLNM
ncbi:MAG: UvrD-helicase domain-containing protein [Cyclobacteriaceae bacterium]|nr:UvrD-helicase domain-containing protein [Cytophagales bacterium]MCZ8327215.1 UvrD-helicase domain-containing protein [Cyclobacteriaceae bacterium]